MPIFAPSYYPVFHCIAEKCQHSCCIGWEIDIDPRTLSVYRSLPKKEAKKILSHTVTQKGTTSFRLTSDERCPFLTGEGLCELILFHGEDILCDICREHPRFYNVFSTHTEMGVGLCCEEAARLILTTTEPFRLICRDAPMDSKNCDPFETDFFATRDEVFALLTDRTQSLAERISTILHRFSLNKTTIYHNDAHWQTIYRSLERLDPQWEDALTAWECASPAPNCANEIASEQLIAYFLYRHLADALDDGRMREHIAFALLSAHVIDSIAQSCGGDDPLATLIDTARAYSAEVEYDEENVEMIMEALDQDCDSSHAI